MSVVIQDGLDATRPALSESTSGSLLPSMRRSCKLRLLVAATGPRDVSWARPLVVRLCKDPTIEMRAIVDDVVPRLSQTVMVLQNQSTVSSANGKQADDAQFYRQQAFELVEWADMLVLAPLDADGIAKMLAGVADTLLLEVLRGWNTEKKMLLIPGMTTHMFSNAMTKKHLSKVQRKWPWVRTVSPILWHYEANAGDVTSVTPKRVVNWNGFNDVLNIIKNQAQLLGLGREIDLGSNVLHSAETDGPVQAKLPPEIWSIILEFVGDWELAQALGIFTTLPMPEPWSYTPKDPNDPRKVYEHELGWTVLTCAPAAICKKISQSPPEFQDLPAVVTKLIIRFSLVDVLAYLENNRRELFKAFDGRVLPTTASAYYARVPVLDYWRASRWFCNRQPECYDAEALDGASMNGHVRVLDWWWRSGLPLRYTEAALEQASGNGHVHVLAWWKDAAAQDDRVVLRPGRSLLSATQHGMTDVLRWWDASGIAVSHGETVAKMASRWGQVAVLELWRTLKGDDKLGWDSDMLVGPTVHAHVDVLEWWKQFARGSLPGMEGRTQRVEYRTCDIEEALEDSIGDQVKVRAWWADNGLNLGLRNMEWMKTRRL